MIIVHRVVWRTVLRAFIGKSPCDLLRRTITRCVEIGISFLLLGRVSLSRGYLWHEESGYR